MNIGDWVLAASGQYRYMIKRSLKKRLLTKINTLETDQALDEEHCYLSQASDEEHCYLSQASCEGHCYLPKALSEGHCYILQASYGEHCYVLWEHGYALQASCNVVQPSLRNKSAFGNNTCVFEDPHIRIFLRAVHISLLSLKDLLTFGPTSLKKPPFKVTLGYSCISMLYMKIACFYIIK